MSDEEGYPAEETLYLDSDLDSESFEPLQVPRNKKKRDKVTTRAPGTIDHEKLEKALQRFTYKLPRRAYEIGSPELRRQSGAKTPPAKWQPFNIPPVTPTKKKKKGEPRIPRPDASLSSRPKEDDKRDRITHSEFVTILGKCIKNYCKETGDVRIDDNSLNFRIVCMKERCRERNRWIISDNNTRYDNICGETAKYTHTCQYEQRSSTTLQKQSGHKFAIGPSLDAGYMGASVGVSGVYEYSKGKSMGEAKDDGKLKTSTVTIDVEPFTAVVVKELTLIVEKTAPCEVELYLKKSDKISYTCSETENKMQKSVEIKDLCKNDDGLKPYLDQWAKDDGEYIVCFLETTCHFYSTENRMETVKKTSKKERYERILKTYTYKHD